MLRQLGAAMMLTLAATTAGACVCNDLGPLDYMVRRADRAFVGTIEKVVELADGSRKATVRVLQDITVRGSRRVEVITGRSDCDLELVAGYTYLISAYRAEGRLTTSACAGTYWLGCDLKGEVRQLTGMRPPDKEPFDFRLPCVESPRWPDGKMVYERGLDLLVGRDGRVEQFEILDGKEHPGIADWRFQPAMLNGRPVAVRMRVPTR